MTSLPADTPGQPAVQRRGVGGDYILPSCLDRAYIPSSGSSGSSPSSLDLAPSGCIQASVPRTWIHPVPFVQTLNGVARRTFAASPLPSVFHVRVQSRLRPSLRHVSVLVRAR